MSRAEICSNEHRFFLASEVQIPAEGKIVLLAFCTACGEPLKLDFTVCSPNTEIQTKKEKHNGQE